MDRNKDEKYLMTPYSLEEDRNKVDVRAGYYIEEVKNAPFRESLAKFAKMVTDRAAVKTGKEDIQTDSPEYWGLYNIITDEQCEIGLKMEKRKPRTLADMKALCPEYSEEELLKQLEEMSYNGVIEWNYENPQHDKRWVVPMYVPGSAEFGNMNDEVLKAHPEVGMFFERMSRIPLQGLTHMIPEG